MSMPTKNIIILPKGVMAYGDDPLMTDEKQKETIIFRSVYAALRPLYARPKGCFMGIFHGTGTMNLNLGISLGKYDL